MAERRNCEKKIEHSKFNLKIGTTNRNNPLVVYVEGKTFISPNFEKESYNTEISDIKRKFKDSISSNLSTTNLFDKSFILDFQIAQSGVSINKKSFLTFQFLLRQNKDNVLKIKEIKEKSNSFINSIINNLETNINNHDFSIFKSKK